MARKGYDFSGWVSKNDVLCTDGTIIRAGAFSRDNGKTVPLVWNHQHNSVDNVIGHAELEERPEGTYAYCYLNDSTSGNNAKKCVVNRDVNALSIFANQLARRGADIIHGCIQEVSLVLSGADKTALIDSVLAHGEESEEEAQISFIGFDDLYIAHADTQNDEEGDKMAKENDDLTIADVLDTMDDNQLKVMGILIDQAVAAAKGGKDNKNTVEHADAGAEGAEAGEGEGEGSDDETIGQILDSLTPKQRKVVEYLVGKALEDASKGSAKEGDNTVKHNAFDTTQNNQEDSIMHADFREVMDVAQSYGSVQKAIKAGALEDHIAHAETNGTAGVNYGIGNIDYLYPDAKSITDEPIFNERRKEWVPKVLNAVHHTPFSRVKTVVADITADAARAKGYTKGNKKLDEVFSLLKRITNPQTIYKKQRLDKDDIDDISQNFNIVAWVKKEMQGQLQEEEARAILIGDGRGASAEDKISEQCIRPVYNDDDLYTVKVPVNVAANASDDDIAKAAIKAIIKARKDYKGSGNPSFYTTEEMLTNMLLLTDNDGRDLYPTVEQLATKLRVKEIVTIDAMEGHTIDISTTEGGVTTTTTHPFVGVIVNLIDYNVGTNGGAKTDFFDDFDIDFNQYKYLYETRLSGALIRPFSAMSVYIKAES